MLLDEYPEVELLDHMVVQFVIWWGASYTVFHNSHTILYSLQKCARVLVFSHPCQHLFFCFFGNRLQVARVLFSHLSSWDLFLLLSSFQEHPSPVLWASRIPFGLTGHTLSQPAERCASNTCRSYRGKIAILEKGEGVYIKPSEETQWAFHHHWGQSTYFLYFHPYHLLGMQEPCV